VGRTLNPGPPLKPDPEFCDCEPPSGGEYARAAGLAFVVMLGGALGSLAVAVVTHRLWNYTTVLVGVAAGWAVNRAAGGHRSATLGIMAGTATLLAAGLGYSLLWLPFVSGVPINRNLALWDLLISGLGAFVAYRLAGPKPSTKKLD
jgi:hypothetical protein